MSASCLVIILYISVDRENYVKETSKAGTSSSPYGEL
jgi:hypothetical protein